MMPGCHNSQSAGPFEQCDVRGEAYSVLSMADFATGTLLLGGLTRTSVRQVFATGAAAHTITSGEAVRSAFVALATQELLSDQTLQAAARLNSGLARADDAELPALLAAINAQLGPPEATDRATAKLRVLDAAENPEAAPRLGAALTAAEPTLRAIEARRAPSPAGGE